MLPNSAAPVDSNVPVVVLSVTVKSSPTVKLRSNVALSVTVAATHAVLSGDAVERLSSDNIDKVFLSDTVYIPENKKFEKLTIISSAQVFADTINRIHKGESVSQLFGKVT